jgi:hypothetical protein
MTLMARLHPDVNLPPVFKTPRLDLSGTPTVRKGNNMLIIVRNEGAADSGPFKIVIYMVGTLGSETPDDSDYIDIANVAAGGTLTFTPSDSPSKPKHFDKGTYMINIFGGPRITADHGALAWTQDLTGI